MEQSRHEGRTEGKIELIMRQLTHRLGAIAPDLQAIVNSLSATALDELSKALLDFSEEAALATWLEQHQV